MSISFQAKPIQSRIWHRDTNHIKKPKKGLSSGQCYKTFFRRKSRKSTFPVQLKYASVATLCWNKALWLAVPSPQFHLTYQSALFQHSVAMLLKICLCFQVLVFKDQRMSQVKWVKPWSSGSKGKFMIEQFRVRIRDVDTT